jgi:hypothetical protein
MAFGVPTYGLMYVAKLMLVVEYLGFWYNIVRLVKS